MRCRRDANEMHDALPCPIGCRYGARMATIGSSSGVGPKGAKKGRFWGGKAAVWGQNGAWGAKKAAVGQNWAVVWGGVGQDGGKGVVLWGQQQLWGRMWGRALLCDGLVAFWGKTWRFWGADGAVGGQRGRVWGSGSRFGVSGGGLGALWVGGTRGVSGPPCWPLGSLGLQAALLHPSMLPEPHSPAGCQHCPKLTLIALIAC